MRTSSFAAQRRSAAKLVISAFLLGAASLAAHLFFLTLHPPTRELYSRMVEQRWHSYETPQGRRGNIYFRDGTLLAGTRKVAKVIIEPGLMTDLQDASLTLGHYLQRPSDEIRAEINGFKGRGMELATGVPLGTALNIDRAGMGGVFTRYYFERTYPHGSHSAAATVGYAGNQPHQRLGLESACDTLLAGTDGRVVYRKDANRQRLPGSELATQSKQDGASITTTLDPAIQTICDDELRRAAEQNRSAWGCIIVMEPHSGHVVGAATYPSFDPNEYVRGRLGPEANVLVHSPVEPGSTIKPLLGAYALDQNWIRADERYVCNRPFTIGKYRIREAELTHFLGDNNGVALDRILIESSNIGMARIALELGQERVMQAYQALGFFARTGIELPAESRGLRPCSWATGDQQWPRISLATTGFGQGMSVTPLQLATAYCVLANGGYRVQPTLVLRGGTGAEQYEAESAEPSLPEGEVLLASYQLGWPSMAARDGSPTELAATEGRPTGRVQVISKETCDQVTQWLELVVKDGTGRKAQLTRYPAAGKTGTAQVPGPRGGYKTGAYSASFAGYFPSRNPRYVVLVLFHEPKGGYYGGAVAAPVFKSVGDRISYIDQLSTAPGI